MPVLESAIEIAATPEEVFDLSQDYGRRLQWDPFLVEARLLDGATRAGVGVKAWCASHPRLGLGLETEYVSFRRPEVAAVRMTRGPWPIGKFAGSWVIRPTASGTRVVFRYHVGARPAWLRWLLEPLMVLWFRRETRKRLEALRLALEKR